MAPAEPVSVVVATHGHCFDGMCAAALFTLLLRSLRAEPLTFVYRACAYGPDQAGIDPARLTGQVNAILDFRYAISPKLTWYFDHHATAFSSPEERADFDADGGRTKFYDPTYGSCTELINDVSRDKFGLKSSPIVRELIRWAGIIDAAKFPTAEMAVVRAEPALVLMTVVENHGGDAFLAKMVPRLLEEPLEAVANAPELQKLWRPLRDAHLSFVETVRATGSERGAVVYVDLTDRVMDAVGKFVTYALYPDSVYSVVVSRGRSRCKISVGYNPWSKTARTHDISSICKRYGGGGHGVVGAVSLPPNDVDRARAIAKEIVAELNG